MNPEARSQEAEAGSQKPAGRMETRPAGPAKSFKPVEVSKLLEPYSAKTLTSDF
jgi:hypothetical protein